MNSDNLQILFAMGGVYPAQFRRVKGGKHRGMIEVKYRLCDGDVCEVYFDGGNAASINRTIRGLRYGKWVRRVHRGLRFLPAPIWKRYEFSKGLVGLFVSP